MDFILLLTGLVQVVLSLIIAVALVYISSKIFRRLITGINESDELKNNNVAVAILNGSIILALILVVKKSIESAITIFSNTLRNPDAILTSYFQSALIMIGHIILGGMIAFTTIYTALQIFMWLTKDLDELKEIKGNNIAVGILLGIIIVSMALLLQPGVDTILNSLIPFPPVSLIDIG
ncbi:MAG: DUF350 domain-containing protein [Ignavibacteriota bacterium]|jgi:uncharacterized membrane protein YjfL (UPF0719 family)|nr:MAG: DUF350 domain-containing protein [Chlorobiota bacterium]MBE7476148.1 DUF350 domain-containing protein [Ignavibacteriales bacterium]MBL1124139.1 DUF350 domain-containing protein [Ignavibacteriota bacterium]MCC7093601.1 DUF350 domain-containing protein [Ignavibacteriaceae bacterium]MCE7857182.1 DUF350 domain-containing protein [Ignavibacteria bacterium CHB3]MEB2297170.1 DUF350 domain-containing protein [Ignavibacteria bacterium]